MSIEEPFSILPLERMWEETDASIAATLADRGRVRALLAGAVGGGAEGERGLPSSTYWLDGLT